MTKSSIVILGVLAMTSSALAQTPAQAPNVICELSYSEQSNDGSLGKFEAATPVQVTAQGASVSKQGYEFNGRLEQICAAGGPCTNAYTLKGQIKHGEYTSYASVTVRGDAKWSRVLSASLAKGNTSVFVNCDVNPRQ